MFRDESIACEEKSDVCKPQETQQLLPILDWFLGEIASDLRRNSVDSNLDHHLGCFGSI